MRAGQLRRQITIEQRSTSRDAFGQELIAWSRFATCWAEIQPLAGRELIAAQAVLPEVSVEVVIRYRPGVDSAMRVLYGSQVYEIGAVLDIDMRHEQLRLLCTQGVTQG